MSLRFIFGPSGAGKSRFVYDEVIRRAGENPKQNFLVIVPDQFTMQTQKDLVLLNERGGIMNIDVLSFGRLGHRILEEVGREEIPVLDDTGKSLVLQKVAASIKEELPTIGSYLSKQGYIHEVKSAISEFMQYGISPDGVNELIDFAGKRGALAQKLKDLQRLYQEFMSYIQGNFITTEETLDVLTRSLAKSDIIPGSVVVFDGFTGFTPIQYRVIQELMRLCDEVVVVLTMGENEDPYQVDNEQKLFYLSKKTAGDLTKLAEKVQVSRGQDSFVKGGDRHRFAQAPALQHLEQNLFRYQQKVYDKEQENLFIFETSNPREAVHQTGLKIKGLVREQGLAYRDIAVIMGDLEGYAPYVETEFQKMDIPCFIDKTRGIVLNPMVEYIKSALELYAKDFSYEAVFHFLRSGLADLEPEEVDVLENYCRQTGVRGVGKYGKLFTRPILEGDAGVEHLALVNGLRERFMSQIEVLCSEREATAKEYVEGLYDFLVQNRVQEKLADFQAEFEEAGQAAKAREYAQIFRLILELLEQIYELLKEEKLTLREFSDILTAGFGEIEVGTIPQNVDRILVGDMERTRLKQVRVLFFLGVNDGNIPKKASKGGIISDMDREYLQESGHELAPSPRQQMFIQRLYLYMNMTKPSESLYLSYVKMDSAGKSVRPAYLIDTVKKLFPLIKVEFPEKRSPLELIVTEQEGAGYLANGLREFVSGTMNEEQEKDFLTLYQAYQRDKLKITSDFLCQAAFERYQPEGLSALVARALYGTNLENSVTRLETYATCAYRHFLQYGLGLEERQEFAFDNADMGNIYHSVLEGFAGKLAQANYTWFDFPEEFAKQAVKEALEEYAATYGSSILYSSYRNEYAIVRMSRILTRTVMTLQRQLKKGSFQPDAYEVSFGYSDWFDSANIRLSEEEKMRLRGRIDRVDVAEDEEHVFVKVIDYKSGDQHFDLAALYYGLQLQLVVYMNAALELEKKKHPDKEVLPAAILYYHIDDPTVETATELSEEEIGDLVAKQLRMNGVVSSEPGIVERLDGDMSSKSDVIPVELKKDGSFAARSSVLSGEELQMVSDFVSRKIVGLGQEIMAGKIDLNPYEMGTKEACTWCSFRHVCGFESTIPGCGKRKLVDMSKDEILKKMQDGTDKEQV